MVLLASKTFKRKRPYHYTTALLREDHDDGSKYTSTTTTHTHIQKPAELLTFKKFKSNKKE